MKNIVILILTVLSLSLLISCGDKPDYSSVENFLQDFISALKNGNQGRYLSFYLQADDFDSKSPGADLAIERFTEAVQNKYLNDCERTARLLSNKQVKIEEMKLDQSNKLVANYLRDVKKNYSNVIIPLTAGDMRIVLEIKEVIQVGNEWRLTTFMTTVDQGTETRDPIHLRQQ